MKPNHSLLAAAVVAMTFSAALAADEKPAPTTQPAATATAPATAPAGLESSRARASYAIGFSMGKNLTDQKVKVESQALIQGMLDALARKEPALSTEQIQAAMMGLQQEMAEQQASAAKDNQTAGEQFLATNAKAEGVKTLPSGLQIKVTDPGKGTKPQATDVVKVHYTGKLLDGTVFDSSRDHGGPATFQLNRVIPGWTEGLQQLGEGGKATLYIPSALGYGDEGAGPIPPASTLIFDVELLEVNPKTDAGQGQ